MKNLAQLMVLSTLVTSNIVYSDEDVSNKEAIQVLANRVCNTIVLYNDTGVGKSWEAFETSILLHIETSKETPNYRAKITEFWNTYHEQMICTDEHIGYTTPQHLLKRVIEMNVIESFYFEYMLRDKNTNFNAVEYQEENPETVIDFIDGIIADPDIHSMYDMNQIRNLRAYLTQIMGAKTAKELFEGKHQ